MEINIFNFSEIFDNKSITVIGPSPHLRGKKLGSFFDTFDLTIRINELCSDRTKNDYGKNNDVIFITLPDNSINHYKNLFSKSKKELESVKHFICPRNSLHVTPFHLQEFKKENNIFKNFEKLNLNHELLHIGDKVNEKIENDIGFHPSTGTLSLAFLSKFNFKQLYISGFSFYLTKQRYNYQKAKLMKKSYNRKINYLPPGHKNIQEILYLQKLFHNKDNVFGDEWFTKLVLEKKFNIDTFNQNKTFDINKI